MAYNNIYNTIISYGWCHRYNNKTKGLAHIYVNYCVKGYHLKYRSVRTILNDQ